MKSLLRFSLMISLIVLGKLNQQVLTPGTAAKPTQAGWHLPVSAASFFHTAPAVKRKISGNSSSFWQATAPASVSTANIE
ncbi:hypothetical protein [Hymenobacter sp. UYP22]|uniref:hypothetical protein n=1 Tax=Hymenobacter sp. UYP22 TaxID=3156348 RepID=UPI0033919BE6